MTPGGTSSDAAALFSLQGRVALVTGAAGYVGRAIASCLARAGATVLLNGRRPEPLEELRACLAAEGLSARVVAGDIARPDTLRAIEAAVAGRLDVLVNNAHAGRAGTIASATEADYLDAFSIAVVAAAKLVQGLAEPLRASGHASVINIASMYGMVSPDPSVYRPGTNNPPFYGAAKGALLQWTRYAAVHLAADNIRVNAISPGPFPAPAVQAAEPVLVSALAARVPLKRIGRADELRGPVLFLASDAASFVTGANIVVDGGWTAW